MSKHRICPTCLLVVEEERITRCPACLDKLKEFKTKEESDKYFDSEVLKRYGV